MAKSKFIPPHPLNTAVLFLVFNRLDTTIKVFEAIRKAKPPRLYIGADGPRKDRPGEEEKVNAVREYLLGNIDWECELKTLFREDNLGCKYAVSRAITWFFKNEEMGIILEDDCLPRQSFFWFCEELLVKYYNENRIMQINGMCYLNNVKIEQSYFFTKYNHIWGWASWRRAWEKYEIDFKNFEDDFNKIDNVFLSNAEKQYWYKVFRRYYDGLIDTWDYSWTFSIWKNNGLAIYPKISMIRNLGFGPEANHTKSSKFNWLGFDITGDIYFIKHPKDIKKNDILELNNYQELFCKQKISYRIYRIIRSAVYQYIKNQ